MFVFPGFKLVEQCHAAGHRSNCTICPEGQFMDKMNSSPNCRSCKKCRSIVTLSFVWISFTALICQCCVRYRLVLFTFSLFSTFLQERMKCWYQNVKDTKTLFVAVKTVITDLTSTQKHTSVSNVDNVELMKSKNNHVSLKIWQRNTLY